MSRSGRAKHPHTKPGYVCYQKGCRLPECVKAQNEYLRDWRVRTGRTKNPTGPQGQQKKGTRACYKKCGGWHPECAEANRTYQREYMRLRRAGVPLTDPHIEEALR